MLRSSRLSLRDLAAGARRELIARERGLALSVLDRLTPEHGLSVEQADHMIENAVGVIGIPVGFACNFTGCAAVFTPRAPIR